MKRILSLCAGLCLIGAASVYGLQAPAYEDMGGHWALPQVERAAEAGYLVDFDQRDFLPDQPVDREEFSALLQSILGVQSVRPNLSNLADPGKITREEAAYLLEPYFHASLSRDPACLEVFSDREAVSPLCQSALALLVDQGYLNGKPDGSCQPLHYLTRAEAVTLLLSIKDGQAALRIPVLAYHHLLPEKDRLRHGFADNDSVLTVEAFQEQMDTLEALGFYAASTDELLAFLQGQLFLPPKTVLITFDDGYLSNGIYAYPILKAAGLQATVFMVGVTANRPQAAFSPRGLQHISVHSFSKYADVLDFGSHSYDLHHMEGDKTALLSLEQETIARDLAQSRDLFQTSCFAYPYGFYEPRTIDTLAELGFLLAFTVHPGYVSRESVALELPRFVIYPRTSLEDFQKLLYGGSQDPS